MSLLNPLWFSIFCGLGAVIYGALSVRWILALPMGNDRMQEIATAVQEGASAYLNRQYSTISLGGPNTFPSLGTSFGLVDCRRIFSRARSSPEPPAI